MIRCGGLGSSCCSSQGASSYPLSPMASYGAGGGTENYNRVLLYSTGRGREKKRREERSSDGRTLSADDVRLNGGIKFWTYMCAATGEWERRGGVPRECPQRPPSRGLLRDYIQREQNNRSCDCACDCDCYCDTAERRPTNSCGKII